MKNLLKYVVTSIVNHPDEVKIEEQLHDDGSILLLLKVDPEDMGQVIGKGGRIIRAIRNLVRVKALGEKKRVGVELVETQ